MADATLRLVLLGVDKSASRALKGVRTEADKTDSKLGKLGKFGKGAALGLAAGLAGAGVAALDFGKDSLTAFRDAERQQAKLEDAYKRFPNLADVNIDSLRDYNQEIQRKVGADADDIAAGQAKLAMFGLTGKQVKDTTGLLVDYATKTGKEIPDAAGVMGKALLGNTKALKDMGISYKSTGDPAKDYANIMDLLKQKVGGYADSVPQIDKKQKILQASFEDLQEKVGEKLQPAIEKLTDAGLALMDWLEANPEVMDGAIAAADLLGKAFEGVWWVISNVLGPAFAWFIENCIVPTIGGVESLMRALSHVPGLEGLGAAADEVGKISKALKKVSDGLDALDGKTANVSVNVRKVGISEIQVSPRGAGKFALTARESGGYYPPHGLLLVGEGGPELLDPSRRYVYDNRRTRQMMGGRGTQQLAINITVNGAIDPLGVARQIQSLLSKLAWTQGQRGWSVRR